MVAYKKVGENNIPFWDSEDVELNIQHNWQL